MDTECLGKMEMSAQNKVLTRVMWTWGLPLLVSISPALRAVLGTTGCSSTAGIREQFEYINFYQFPLKETFPIFK